MNVGIPIYGVKVDMLRFADDIAVITESVGDLQEILSEMDRIMKEEFNMNINRQKTKMLVTARIGKIKLQ